MRRWIMLCVALLLAGCNLARGSNTPSTPIATPDVPFVEILAPPNNRQILEQVVFEVDIVAQDLTDGVARIELLIDGEPYNEALPDDGAVVSTFRAIFNWRAPQPGRYALEAIAYRVDGTASDPARITIEVLPRE